MIVVCSNCCGCFSSWFWILLLVLYSVEFPFSLISIMSVSSLEHSITSSSWSSSSTLSSCTFSSEWLWLLLLLFVPFLLFINSFEFSSIKQSSSSTKISCWLPFLILLLFLYNGISLLVLAVEWHELLSNMFVDFDCTVRSSSSLIASLASFIELDSSQNTSTDPICSLLFDFNFLTLDLESWSSFRNYFLDFLEKKF